MAGVGSAHLSEANDLVLSARELVVQYPTADGAVMAVAGVSLDIRRGETLGLVGESGCGKSSTGRAIAMLTKLESGEVRFEGHEIQQLSERALRSVRSRLLMIFQDPVSSLNPRRRVRDIVAEGLAISGASKPWNDAIETALRDVGLPIEDYGDRYPHELSGGQAQRVAIARALVLKPSLVICDEPVSALDISVQAQVLNLLEDLKERYELSLLFIAHDLAVVKSISDRVAVMYLGVLCEITTADRLYAEPQHPYTMALLEAVPEPDPAAVVVPLEITGEPPSPVNPPSGCRFRTRCPRAQARCTEEIPQVRAVLPDHYVACHYPEVEFTGS